MSQSSKVKKRADKLKFRWKDFFKPGQCSICRREGVIIVNVKHKLCKQCHRWCKNYLRVKFGYYKWENFIEVVQSFLEPVKCQFYHICGNTTTRLKEDGTIRKGNKPWVCPNCYPMWEAGFKSGKLHIKDTVKKGRQINDKFNQ